MTAISAAVPSLGDALAQLISGGPSAAVTPPAAGTDSTSDSSPASTDTSGPAAFVTLSQQAKAAAALRVVSDQAAAEQLQAYVVAHRANSNGTQSAADTQTTAAQPTGSSKVAVIVAQIKTLANADEPPPFQAFTPTKSISNSLTVDGFTVTLATNASTQFYGTQVTGNGTQIFDEHFGPSDEAGGGSGVAPGVSVSSQMVDNNEALEAVTVTRNVATATSVSASSSAGSISTSSVNVQSSSTTFLVNYATGQISAEANAVSVSARSTSVGLPGSTLSTLA